MDVKTKTKDNPAAREDMNVHCRKRKGFGEGETPPTL